MAHEMFLTSKGAVTEMKGMQKATRVVEHGLNISDEFVQVHLLLNP